MRTATVAARPRPTLTVISGGADADNPLRSIVNKLPELRSKYTENGELPAEEGGNVAETQLIAIGLIETGCKITGAVLEAANAGSTRRRDRLGRTKFMIAASWVHGLAGSAQSDRIRVSRSWGRGPVEYDPSSPASRDEMTRMLSHHIRRLKVDKRAWMIIELIVKK